MKTVRRGYRAVGIDQGGLPESGSESVFPLDLLAIPSTRGEPCEYLAGGSIGLDPRRA
jgi:hypothetical protein